jgi:rubrerythrin
VQKASGETRGPFALRLAIDKGAAAMASWPGFPPINGEFIMLKFLNSCAEIEDTIGAIYRLLAETLSEGHELRRIWLEMADEEAEHARQIRFAARLPAREVFTGVNISLSKVEELLRRAREFKERLQGAQITTSEALKLSMHLETEFNAVHMVLAVEFREESMRRMFQSLASDDDRHANRLRQYLLKISTATKMGAGA